MNEPKILFTLPMKMNDPTQFTYQWGQKAVNIAKSLGYKIIVVEKDHTTYNNITKILKENPDIKLVVHFGHGCINSIQGNKGCFLAKKYEIEEIVGMALDGYANKDTNKIKVARLMLEPLCYLGSNETKNVCKLNDPCDLLCQYPTNADLLLNKVVYATACFSAAGLGKSAIEYGANSYVGFDDLFLFPIDSMGSQNIYGNIQLIGLKELLVGHTPADAEAAMIAEEDKLIRKYKKVKYIALTLLWNKMNRRVLGNQNATIYSNPFPFPFFPY